MTRRGGLFAANLDVERTWALRAGLRPRATSAAALTRASRLGLLCSVLAPDAETLWLPAPVNAACLRAVPGLPRPRTVSGPFPKGATAGFGDPDAWEMGHRRWAFEHAEAWGTSVTDAAFVRSLAEFVACPAAGGAWVLKAPYAAAGRHRVLGSGARPTDGVREAIERLLSSYGELLLEPWMDRRADFGCAVQGERVLLHGLRVDARGRFSGIHVGGGDALEPGESQRLRDLAGQVGTALGDAGYGGPYGFDAYRHCTPAGEVRLRALCEVNPRFTFGHIAHALAPVARAAWGDAGSRFSLRVGDVDEAQLGREALSLVGSPDGRRAHAWLVREPE